MAAWDFELGDKVAGNNIWQEFNSSKPGTVVRRYESEGVLYYTVRYKDRYTDGAECDYNAKQLKLVGPALPVYEAEIIGLGIGRAVYSFRAETAGEANEKVTGLVNGTSTGPTGDTLEKMIGCRNPPDGWRERLVVMYIKQVR